MRLTDSVMQKIIEREGCQYMGPDQDPRKGPVTICGHKVIDGKAYCAEHYPVVYMVGSSITKLGKGRSAAAVAKKQHEWDPGEMETLLQECYDELVEEGEIEA